MLNFFKKYIFILILIGLLVIPAVSNAAPWQLVPKCGDGGCNVCDAIGVGINIAKIMLGTLGSAALLVFVYGGFLMLYSRGHNEYIQKGKDALINAVKGVIIVLGSWVIVNYGLAIMLGQEKDLGKVSLFGENQQWYKVACSGGSGGFTITGPCNGKNAGDECESGKACSITGICVSKECKLVFNDTYSCQDINIRAEGKNGCEPGYCGGTNSIMCCPKAK